MLHGLLLALPADLVRSGGPDLGTVPFGYETADRIRARIASPVHAAALATALFTGCTAKDLADTVTIEALAEDAALFAVPGPGGQNGTRTAVFVVPEPARPFLAAARTFLRLPGTPPPRKLLYPGIGKDGEILAASAEAPGCRCRSPNNGSTSAGRRPPPPGGSAPPSTSLAATRTPARSA